MATRPIDFRHVNKRALRAEVFVRYDFTCQGCGWSPAKPPEDYDGRQTIAEWVEGRLVDLHIDHVVPRSAGGSHEANPVWLVQREERGFIGGLEDNPD